MTVFHLDWMKFYPGETLADGRFQAWTMDERGAWFSLVLQCWRDGSIPAGVTAIGRLLHVDTQDATRIWSAIGDRFSPHPTEAGRLISPRLEEEREKALAIASIRSDAGTKGATSRWHKPKPTHGKRMRQPSQTDSGANAEAVANDAGLGRGSGSTHTEREQPPGPPPTPTRARLVSPFGAADPYPQTSAVLAALYERNLDVVPPAERSAGRVEAAIESVGIPTAIERLVAIYADPEAKKPLTYHVTAIRGDSTPAAPPPLPALDAAWLGALPVELRPTAEEAWQHMAEDVARASYADARPRLVAEARDHFQATWRATA
jgi:hypothetical protein